MALQKALTQKKASRHFGQFAIWQIGLLTFGVACAILPIRWWGIDAWPVSVWVVATGLAVAFTFYRILGGLLALGLLVLLALPAINASRTSYPRNSCISNLKQLALAIANYESEEGHLPPPFVADASGVPMHSWRILILPYMEEQELYDQYDFTKPWNHPDNLKLADKMPSVFRCPSDPSPYSQQTTCYVAVVGPNTMWPPAGERRLTDVTDGVSKTLLLIESDVSRTHWMAPNDASFDDIVSVARNDQTMLLTSGHEHKVLGVFTDAYVTRLPESLPADELRAILTINGKEDVDPNSF